MNIWTISSVRLERQAHNGMCWFSLGEATDNTGNAVNDLPSHPMSNLVVESSNLSWSIEEALMLACSNHQTHPFGSQFTTGEGHCPASGTLNNTGCCIARVHLSHDSSVSCGVDHTPEGGMCTTIPILLPLRTHSSARIERRSSKPNIEGSNPSVSVGQESCPSESSSCRVSVIGRCEIDTLTSLNVLTNQYAC